jgi:flagellar motor switch protein FliN/FliY
VSSSDALTRLGQSTAEACAGVLETFAAGKITVGEVTTGDNSKAAFAGVPVPSVAMSVSYVDGVTGGNVFLLTVEGARALAASMMGMDQPEDPDATELSELELSAVSEAMNQMMASAAAATSVVLGTEVEISTPETETFTSADEIAEAYPATPHAVRTAMTVCGEPARLVQLVPNAFVVRMSSALDDLGAEVAPTRPLPAPRSPRHRHWPASRSASGPSWAGRECPRLRSSACPRAPSWSSTSRLRNRSTCT